MTFAGWLQILVYALVILALTKPLGIYLHGVLEGERRPLERALYRACGVDPRREQSWLEYTFALLAFSFFGLLVTYAIRRLQALLPLNPQGMTALSEHLAWNTAVSFTTNTNWQSYGGETTLSYLSQMAALAWHNFTSAAAGIAVAIALARGLTRQLPEKGVEESNITEPGEPEVVQQLRGQWSVYEISAPPATPPRRKTA